MSKLAFSPRPQLAQEWTETITEACVAQLSEFLQPWLLGARSAIKVQDWESFFKFRSELGRMKVDAFVTLCTLAAEAEEEEVIELGA